MFVSNRLFVLGVFLMAMAIEQGHCFFWGTRWERSFFVPGLSTTNNNDDCRREAIGNNAPAVIWGDFRQHQGFLSNVGLNNPFSVCEVLVQRRHGLFVRFVRTSYSLFRGTVGSLFRAIIA
ncbi:hypothetical protein TCAL_13993 [Tigriopus californicus]|uniref:Secreted protein n=1 Tax=Tigriopus californicus TaxID=6832 RepID=A0A553NKR6_TIGCA|nr:uncharacterized protein LOC131892547 [Tigriopus californicus]TRY66014.1 hypothetical protein TCAL_13993 [Tigriopus californicus]|eukprot:TCALIF_13993-PA protein Name:"Protein of unknown function" AED:0.00 eAED:0.00 QI:19/1/1/1/1/1/2/186/120